MISQHDKNVALGPRRSPPEKDLPGSGPLYGRVRDRLRRDILRGLRGPKEKLATEKELSDHFGVSRITVRRALRELRAEGLIVSAQGRGIFVARPRVTQDIRRMEAFGETVCAQLGETNVRLLSLREETAPAWVARELRSAADERVTVVHQVHYLRGTPVLISESFLPLAIGRRLLNQDLSIDTLTAIKNVLGLRVQGARIEIEACFPDTTVQKALQVSSEVPVLRLCRVFIDRIGRVIDVELLSFREDTFNCKFRTEPNKG